MKRRLLPLLIASATALYSCGSPSDPAAEPSNDLRELKIPRNFNFTTTKERQIDLRFRSPDGQPLRNFNMEMRYSDALGSEYSLGQFSTDREGRILTALEFETAAHSLIIVSTFPGLPDRTEIPASGSSIVLELGGAPVSTPQKSTPVNTSSFELNGYFFLGTFNSQGVPSYLEPIRDVISQPLLNDINASLPETRPVPIWNPDYLKGPSNLDSKITDNADVWVTFVHEGAGWMNTLAFYTYDLANPPASVAEIQQLNIVFPNVSFVNSGGGLTSGDKVYLGRYPAGTGIGWVLLPNAWDAANKTVRNISSLSQGVKYSNAAFNTNAGAEFRQHFIALKDETRELVLLGFEDTTRPGGDNDFNDAIFYVTANPYTAIDVEDILPVQIAKDSDGDSIFDHLDNYPNDPERAFDQFFPGAGKFGSLAFEDLWPNQGDYDFNDLVVEYNYQLVTNASNRVKDVKSTWTTKAVGGIHRNALAFVLNVTPESVQSVQGQRIFGGMVQRDANGTEKKQDKAVIFVYDDAFRLLTPPAGYKLVNAEPGAPAVAPVTVALTVTLKEAQPAASLGAVPFNPFLVSNQRRGFEIHLPEQPPTNLADANLFGTGDDASKPGVTTYKTVTGLPWALHLPAAFVHPYENQSILTGHLKFREWAESGGVRFSDWYMNKTGYRNTAVLWK